MDRAGARNEGPREIRTGLAARLRQWIRQVAIMSDYVGLWLLSQSVMTVASGVHLVEEQSRIPDSSSYTAVTGL